MRNLGVLVLFIVSLIAYCSALETRRAAEVPIELSSAKAENAAVLQLGVFSRNGDDAGLPLEGTIQPLRDLDLRKLERAYRFRMASRPER